MVVNNPLNKALFPGGGGIGEVGPLDSHDNGFLLKDIFVDWEYRLPKLAW